MNCIFSDENTNYGDLDAEGKNKKMLRKIFLQNALMYYNTCVDLSWCLVVFYCVPKKEGKFNITNEEIEKIENSISFDYLQEYLNLQLNFVNVSERVILDQLIEKTKEFWYNTMPDGFRQDYNYIKHKGTFDIFDMEKEENQLFLVNNKTPNIVIPKFKEFDSEKYAKMLRDFHNAFLEYINDIIDIIIKPKFKPSKYSFEEITRNIINNSEI